MAEHMVRKRMTPEGRQMLLELEGRSRTVYKDVAGLPTIGVGHLLTKDELTSGKIQIGQGMVKYKDGLSSRQVEQLFEQDLESYEFAVDALTTPPLLDRQFDALASFAFNVGVAAFSGSTLRKKLNAIQFDEVPVQMRRWIYSGGRTWDGLVARREVEIQRWLAA